MRIFALKKIEQVKGKSNFYKLEINNKCQFDEFCELLEKKGDESKLKSIYAIMDAVANLNFLPDTKFKELSGRRPEDKIKDYEIKKDKYRVYLFKDDAGNIVVFGSIKKRQKRDIKRLRAIKTEYIKNKKL